MYEDELQKLGRKADRHFSDLSRGMENLRSQLEEANKTIESQKEQIDKLKVELRGYQDA